MLGERATLAHGLGDLLTVGLSVCSSVGNVPLPLACALGNGKFNGETSCSLASKASFEMASAFIFADVRSVAQTFFCDSKGQIMLELALLRDLVKRRYHACISKQLASRTART